MKVISPIPCCDNTLVSGTLLCSVIGISKVDIALICKLVSYCTPGKTSMAPKIPDQGKCGAETAPTTDLARADSPEGQTEVLVQKNPVMNVKHSPVKPRNPGAGNLFLAPCSSNWKCCFVAVLLEPNQRIAAGIQATKGKNGYGVWLLGLLGRKTPLMQRPSVHKETSPAAKHSDFGLYEMLMPTGFLAPKDSMEGLLSLGLWAPTVHRM